MKKITSLTRKAVEDYHMILEGDRIAVGVSGGKDSLALLLALKELQFYYPQRFDLIAISLDMGFEGTDYSAVRELCNSKGIPYIIKKTDIAQIVFDIRKEPNPCSLCAKLRRGALNDLAKEHGCNKVALGHHNDDVVETFFLSLFYEGRLSCFTPVTHLTRKDIYAIRPLIYVPESVIVSAARRLSFPVVCNPCPADGYTKRQEIKKMIQQYDVTYKGFKQRIFGAVQKGIEGWKL